MIDKLDLRIPSCAKFTERFERVINQLRVAPVPPFTPSKRYRYVGDLRHWYDIDAVLHLDFKFGECTHKLEIVDVGQKTLRNVFDIVREVFDIDPASLELMRIDLAIDIENVSVEWFRKNVRASYKRLSSRIDKNTRKELEFVGIDTAESETFYIGKRPNCYRIYNKVVEMHRRWKKLCLQCERFNRQLDNFALAESTRTFAERTPPSFAEFCAAEGFLLKPGVIVTRVERQFGGGRIPSELSTLGGLQCLPTFDPFDALQIVVGSLPTLQTDPGAIPMRDWLAVKGLDALIKEQGSVQSATAIVRRYARGNGKRILDTLVPHLPQTGFPVDSAFLRKSFQSTVTRQLQSPASAIYSPPTYD